MLTTASVLDLGWQDYSNGMKNVLTLLVLSLVFVLKSVGQEAADLAKKLANPIASLISLPLQNNSDFGIGELNGSRNTLNIQPVWPISITKDINLITRIVLPVITQQNITGPGESQSGFSDAVLSGFFSPKEVKNGFTWGVGPVFLLPFGKQYLTLDNFGMGPTAVALKQGGGFTYGALVNQIWGLEGSDKPEVSQLFFQPFLVHNWPSGAGAGANFEVTRNWSAENTTIWFNPFVNAVTAIGKQKVQLGLGPRFNLAAPDGGKADWGLRTILVFLFTK